MRVLADVSFLSRTRKGAKIEQRVASITKVVNLPRRVELVLGDAREDEIHNQQGSSDM